MNSAIEQLPKLGLGGSLSLSSKPDPVKLFQIEGGAKFIEHAGLVDVERVVYEVKRVQDASAALFYHPSYINFFGSFPNSTTWLETT